MEQLHRHKHRNQPRTEIHGNHNKSVKEAAMPHLPLRKHEPQISRRHDRTGCPNHRPCHRYQHSARKAAQPENILIILKMNLSWQEIDQTIIAQFIGADGIDDQIIKWIGTQKSEQQKDGIIYDLKADILFLHMPFFHTMSHNSPF